MGEREAFVTQVHQVSLSGTALEDLMGAVLEKGLPFRFRARGWSMSPFIRDGDLVSLSPLSVKPAAVGDVVAYQDPVTGILTVHRIVSKGRGAYTIMGDNQVGPADGPIPAENIIGRVIRVERDGAAVRLGLGPEKALIARLSRNHLLQPALTRLAWFIYPLRRALS